MTSTGTSLRGATRSMWPKCFTVGHVPRHQQQQRRQRRHRQVAEQRRQRPAPPAARRARAPSPRSASARPSECWSPCARSRRSPGCRRRTARPRCRCPAPAARRRGRGACRAMPSAITAESSDSMAPSIAIANAPDSTPQRREAELKRRAARAGRVPRQHRQRRQRRNAVDHVPADRRVKARGDRRDRVARKEWPRCAAASSDRDRQRHERRRDPPQAPWDQQQHRQRRRSDPSSAERGAAPRVPHRRDPIEEVLRAARQLQPEHVLDLQRRDHRGDAGGEARRDRVGDELDEAPEPGEAHRDQHARRPSRPRSASPPGRSSRRSAPAPRRRRRSAR